MSRFVVGGVLANLYHWTHPHVPEDQIPYWYKRSICGEIWHLVRKGICQNIAPNCVLTPFRIGLYRLCGFKIGKGCFIGMKCYLDDLCIDKIEIGNNVTISYGVYFACHGRKQGHNRIVIKDGAYIGMRANITARHDLEIGAGAVVGAGTLVNKSVPDGATCVGVPGRIVTKKDELTHMENFKLYKGAWVSDNPQNSKPLTQAECKELLNRGGYLVRNVFDFDCKEETSFWYVIKDSFRGMEELSSRTRNKIRKSLRLCEVRRVTKEELNEQGYEVHRSAAAAYRVKAHVPTREEFETRLTNQDDCYEYWGSFRRDNGQMIAFSMNYINGNCAEYQTFKAIPAYRTSHYTFYGLLYEMNHYYLEEKGLKFVNDGARSITNHSNVQPFLMDTFNFRKAYCHIELTYKWWFGMAVKVLYPFRRFIQFAKVKAILNMEAMARGEI